MRGGAGEEEDVFVEGALEGEHADGYGNGHRGRLELVSWVELECVRSLDGDDAGFCGRVINRGCHVLEHLLPNFKPASYRFPASSTESLLKLQSTTP